MNSSKRNALLLAVVAAASAYLFHRFADSFWGVVVSAAIAAWALFYALPVMDPMWRLKTGFVLAVFLVSGISLWPTAEAMSRGKLKCPAYVKSHITFGIAQGLDLQGGLRLVYTVEVEGAIADKRNNFAEEMRQELGTIFQLHTGEGRISREEMAQLESKVRISTPETSFIRLKFKDAADRAKIDERFQKKFAQELSQSLGPANDEVTFKLRGEVESQIRERAVAQAKDTVSRRVDELGLREASVTTRDEDIIVEVPGHDQKAFDDIKEIIRRTARLEFKMVDDEGSAEFFKQIKDESIPPGEGISIEQLREQAPNGVKDGKNVSVAAQYAKIVKRPDESLDSAKLRFKKWIETLPIRDDRQIGYQVLTEYDADQKKLNEVGWRTLYLFKRAEVTGDYIVDAAVQQDQQSGAYLVALTFSPVGGDRFEEVTGANVNRRFAIMLDDKIDSAPVIKTKIGGGRATITMGSGDPEQQLANARQLELVLRSGALPAQITPSNESHIGPSLGKDAIDQGVKGMLVSSALVLAFMILYYRKAGLVADLAVLFNMFLQLAILASFSATMTLPGIAGLALTIGIAVDANVLINERIREELRAGRSPRAAVEAGYSKAFSAIIDGHVTVFISGLILWQYGSGPVKGFAITLIVGIVASLFTGVFCTRLAFDWWTRGAKTKTLSVGAEF